MVVGYWADHGIQMKLPVIAPVGPANVVQSVHTQCRYEAESSSWIFAIAVKRIGLEIEMLTLMVSPKLVSFIVHVMSVHLDDITIFHKRSENFDLQVSLNWSWFILWAPCMSEENVIFTHQIVVQLKEGTLCKMYQQFTAESDSKLEVITIFQSGLWRYLLVPGLPSWSLKFGMTAVTNSCPNPIRTRAWFW